MSLSISDLISFNICYYMLSQNIGLLTSEGTLHDWDIWLNYLADDTACIIISWLFNKVEVEEAYFNSTCRNISGDKLRVSITHLYVLSDLAQSDISSSVLNQLSPWNTRMFQE